MTSVEESARLIVQAVHRGFDETEAAITAIQGRLDALAKGFQNGVFPLDHYRKRGAELRGQLDDLNAAFRNADEAVKTQGSPQAALASRSDQMWSRVAGGGQSINEDEDADQAETPLKNVRDHGRSKDKFGRFQKMNADEQFEAERNQVADYLPRQIGVDRFGRPVRANANPDADQASDHSTPITAEARQGITDVPTLIPLRKAPTRQSRAPREREGFPSVPPAHPPMDPEKSEFASALNRTLGQFVQVQQTVAGTQQTLAALSRRIATIEALNRKLIDENRRLVQHLDSMGPSGLNSGSGVA